MIDSNKSLETLWQWLCNHIKILDDILEKIEGGIQHAIERFYDWQIISRQILKELRSDDGHRFILSVKFLILPVYITLSTPRVCMKCNILKLENQIPVQYWEMFFITRNQKQDIKISIKCCRRCPRCCLLSIS